MVIHPLFRSCSLKGARFQSVARSMGALLLGSPLLFGVISPAQALPSWLNLETIQAQTGSSTERSGETSPERTTPSTTAPQNLSEVRFSCQLVNGQHTVMYNPQSQPGQYYPWATPTALGGGWSPERRCNEISRRLEVYRPDGLLELKTGLENGYNTVCVTTETVPSCRIVLTVPPGQDAVAVRDRIFNNLLVADSGQQTSAVVAYQENESGILQQIGQALGINLPGGTSGVTGPRRSSPSSINLRPFLDPADGGTGTRLLNSTGSPSGGSGQLNPDNFR